MQFHRGVSPLHIKALNLITTGDSWKSGSLSMIDPSCYGGGNLPIDGFHILDKTVLVGWAAIFDTCGGDFLPVHEAHFMIRPSHRRKGLGLELHRRCLALYPDMQVVGWNYISREFFLSASRTNKVTGKKRMVTSK